MPSAATAASAVTTSSFDLFKKRREKNLSLPQELITLVHLLPFPFFCRISNKLNGSQRGASFCRQTCLRRNDTSKLVIVWSVGGLSRGLLWCRVHDPSQNPQMDCNQEPLAVCLTLSSLFLSVLSPRDTEFFKTRLHLLGKKK